MPKKPKKEREHLNRAIAKKLKLYFHGYVPDDIIDDLNGQLKDLLKMIEVEIELHESPTGEKYIDLYYDPMITRKAIRRDSGVEKKYLNDIAPQQIRERMAAGETAAQIAESLGITRSTLFRRLKKAEELQKLSDQFGRDMEWKL